MDFTISQYPKYNVSKYLSYFIDNERETESRSEYVVLLVSKKFNRFIGGSYYTFIHPYIYASIIENITSRELCCVA